MKLRLLTILCAASLAGYGCGGGGGDGGAKPPTILGLTGATPPVETGEQQQARATELVKRADSLIVSTMHVERTADQASSFTVPYQCTGATCRSTWPGGEPDTTTLDDGDGTLQNPVAVGTEHGVTVIRGSGRT